MYRQKQKINTLLLSFASAILFAGCGGGDTGLSSAQNEPLEITQKNLRASTYISKGNFVEVASFAYKKVTDSSFTQESLDVSLPGGELIEPSSYSISAIEDHEAVQKIIVQNHLNRLEIKLMDENRVNILLQGTNFTIDRKMALADFIAASEGK